MNRDRLVSATGAMLEVVLVVAVTAVLATLLLAPFVRDTVTAEIPLSRLDESPDSESSPRELTERLKALGLARRVELLVGEEQPRLVLTGIESEDGLSDRVSEILRESGYRDGEPAFERLEWPRGLARETLPWAMTVQALVFLVVAGLFGGRRRLRIESPPAGPWRAILLGIGGGVAAFVLSSITALLLDRFGLQVREQPWVLELLEEPRLLIRLLPWIVLIVPVSEELFFRGYVLRLLARRAGPAAGALISSILFAVFHFNPSGFVVYLGIGLVLAYVCLRSNDLRAPIAAHATHNGIIVALALLAG